MFLMALVFRNGFISAKETYMFVVFKDKSGTLKAKILLLNASPKAMCKQIKKLVIIFEEGINQDHIISTLKKK